MENIDIDFSFTLNQTQNQHYNRQQVLQKYIKALQQFRDYAETTYHLRPYLFDNYILFHYFQQQQPQRDINQTDNASLSISSNSTSNAESWIIFLKMELLNHILDRRRQIMHWLFYLILFLLCVFVYRYKASTLMAERGVQSMLYSSMRMWRRLTLPLIQRFPRLTELYDESCLMDNPFFQVDNLSCKSCTQVDGVIEIPNNDDNYSTNEPAYDNDHNVPNYEMFNKKSYNSRDRKGNRNRQNKADYLKVASSITTKHVPFTFKNNHTPIDLIDFYKLYINNREIFQRDAYRVQSTNPNINNLEELFSQQINNTKNSTPITSSASSAVSSSPPANKLKDNDRHRHEQSHTLWRCNRMLPARLLRQLIPRPNLLPNSLAMERFVAIDTSHASSYTLPNTECPHVYIQQLLGARFIILRPTSECRQHCRTLSIRLPQAFVLSYNWWYWKPISVPDSVSDTLSISLIGSYC